jgi:alkanesulfonate monooxygenase SsuD/methylene tetrahydromethanopterin reductase-like flavin-dependent oxidoreductase (luciferase family)
MSDAVPLGTRLRFGTMVSTSSREEATRGLESISRWGYEVLWAPDHVAFTGPVNDPLTTLAYLSALEPKLTFGTSVYLLPLRHPVPVAKMVATLDRLLGAGHFIFGSASAASSRASTSRAAYRFTNAAVARPSRSR